MWSTHTKYSRAWRPPSTWILDLGPPQGRLLLPLTSHTRAGRAPPDSSDPSLPWNNPGAGRKRARPRPQARSPIPRGPPRLVKSRALSCTAHPGGLEGPVPLETPLQGTLGQPGAHAPPGYSDLVHPSRAFWAGAVLHRAGQGGAAAGNRGAGQRRTRPPIHMQLRNPRNVYLATAVGPAPALHGSPARKQASPGSSPSSRKPSGAPPALMA